MGKIQLLNEELINKIAAGEVIERPASVVKELTENSLDAGATEIVIRFIQAGKKLISVSDNGCGMSKDDALLALERHATSKISNLNDLTSIHTLGFRGEALPSISAVSKLNLTTYAPESENGWCINVNGGKNVNTRPCGTTMGTTIEVKDLFYNTPARLKFLKSEYTEREHIITAITDLALSHPETGFKLFDSEKKVFSCFPTTDIKQRISGIFGARIISELFHIESLQLEYEISGWLSQIPYTRNTKTYQLIALNHRPIRSRTLNHAIYQAYRDATSDSGRHPNFFLYINCNSQLLDVNVHPTKREIRISNEDKMYRDLYTLIRNRLQKISSIPTIATIPLITKQASKPQSESEPTSVSMSTLPRDNQQLPTNQNRIATKQPVSIPEELFNIPSSDQQQEFSQLHIIPLAQLGKLFILAQTEEGLIIIDQHAASERIFYEKFKKSFAENRIQVQGLLEPIVLDLPPHQRETLKLYKDHFIQLGFIIEQFGEQSYVLKAVPALVSDSLDRSVFLEILENLKQIEYSMNNKTQPEEIKEKIIRASCKTAIKSNDHLEKQEMFHLIDDLKKCSFPYTCAHGRPTIIKLSYRELERRFGRRN